MTAASSISPQRRIEIIDSLRRGTVPTRSLDAFAVGLSQFSEAIDGELTKVASGGAVFKAIRGEYGSGKTFFIRWLQDRAKKQGFATAEVQVSEMETPLHRLETVYRRVIERLSTADVPQGALRSVIDGWFFTLEEDILASGIDASEGDLLTEKTSELIERKLAPVSRIAPSFAQALRAYHRALQSEESEIAEQLVAWLSADPNVSAAAKRYAGIKGEIDHFGALGFLRGLLLILRDSGYSGMVFVLDEVETLQRVRGDIREKSLNALRQLMDDIDGGVFTGLYLATTGTPAFFDGPQGVQRLPPLAQRLAVDFSSDPRFDNPRAVQIRLPQFTFERLHEVGCRVRDLFAADAKNESRIRTLANDEYLGTLARGVAGKLGGKVGVAPRVFLKKLVGEILDRIDLFPDFDPRQHYALTVQDSELTEAERGSQSVDAIDLDLES